MTGFGASRGWDIRPGDLLVVYLQGGKTVPGFPTRSRVNAASKIARNRARALKLPMCVVRVKKVKR